MVPCTAIKILITDVHFILDITLPAMCIALSSEFCLHPNVYIVLQISFIYSIFKVKLCILRLVYFQTTDFCS